VSGKNKLETFYLRVKIKLDKTVNYVI
jgi:hypothetical protein